MQKKATNSALLPECAAQGAQRIQGDAEQEERVVGVLAPDIVGKRRPEEPAADVEQREKPGETGGDGRDQRALIRRELREPDARLPISEPPKISCSIGEAMPMTPIPAETLRHEHRPDQPELLGLVRVTQVHLVLGDHGLGLARRRPAFRPPTGRRDPIAECADHHEHEIDRGHGEERLPYADEVGVRK